jgi:hypothetical protein
LALKLLQKTNEDDKNIRSGGYIAHKLYFLFQNITYYRYDIMEIYEEIIHKYFIKSFNLLIHLHQLFIIMMNLLQMLLSMQHIMEEKNNLIIY